ncbi:MAG TPA: 5'/3'-nucleotidase SurE [Nitrososphaerales archaeon]|nr:5'/3'-nucleotidase SurE [Nitrososphaerales archaeon]
MPRKLVMVTNDDSVQSRGMIELAKAIERFAEVTVVAPEAPQSATALSLTFHKPLRVAKVNSYGVDCYAVSGSPGDCVMIGVNKLLPRRPDLVVSGINMGDNDTYQDVLASGTVAAAIESALTGIPAIAFSMEVAEESLFSFEMSGGGEFVKAAEIASEIVRDALENGMPSGAEILNVNFPSRIDARTQLALTEVGRRKYTDKVLVRKDPRGRAYYWLFGERLPQFAPNSDAEAVIAKHQISITPLALDLSGPMTEGLEEMKKRVEGRLAKRGRRDK